MCQYVPVAFAINFLFSVFTFVLHISLPYANCPVDQPLDAGLTCLTTNFRQRIIHHGWTCLANQKVFSQCGVGNMTCCCHCCSYCCCCSLWASMNLSWLMSLLLILPMLQVEKLPSSHMSLGYPRGNWSNYVHKSGSHHYLFFTVSISHHKHLAYHSPLMIINEWWTALNIIDRIETFDSPGINWKWPAWWSVNVNRRLIIGYNKAAIFGVQTCSCRENGVICPSGSTINPNQQYAQLIMESQSGNSWVFSLVAMSHLLFLWTHGNKGTRRVLSGAHLISLVVSRSKMGASQNMFSFAANNSETHKVRDSTFFINRSLALHFQPLDISFFNYDGRKFPRLCGLGSLSIVWGSHVWKPCVTRGPCMPLLYHNP